MQQMPTASANNQKFTQLTVNKAHTPKYQAGF